MSSIITDFYRNCVRSRRYQWATVLATGFGLSACAQSNPGRTWWRALLGQLRLAAGKRRREPTDDVIQQLGQATAACPACGPGMDHTCFSRRKPDIFWPPSTPVKSWDMRDYPACRPAGGDGGQMAQANKDTVSWWNMAHLQASSLLKNADYEGCNDVIRDGAARIRFPKTRPGWPCGLSSLWPPPALGWASCWRRSSTRRSAVQRGAYPSPRIELRTSQRSATLIAALAESGTARCRPGRIARRCPRLVDDALLPNWRAKSTGSSATSPSCATTSKRALANHARAGKLLSPASDLALWARFNKATASVRLSAGVVEPETLEAIERAELAQSVVGANAADALEVSTHPCPLALSKWGHGDRPGTADQAA